LNGIGGSRKGKKMCKMTLKVGVKNTKDRCKCRQSMNLGALRLKLVVRLIAEEGHENLFRGRDPNSGTTN
jgi:hypothetical protein